MKKILRIIVICLLLSSNSFADNHSIEPYRLNTFAKWLFINGHHEYLEINKTFTKLAAICKDEPKYSVVWYYNKCDEPESTNNFKIKNNLKIKIFEGWIPEDKIGISTKYNHETLLYEFFKYNIFPFIREKHTTPDKYEIAPSSNPYKFKSNLQQEDKYINKTLNKTGLISYLRFEDGQITMDKISPNDRLGKFINNKTKLRAMSVSKTMVSYVTGHAICGGYIDSINSRLNDWPLIENTLYYDQKLIDLLNFKAGDRNHVVSHNIRIKNTGFAGVNYRHDTEDYMSVFKGTKKIKNAPFNYSEMATQLILNYVLFKTGDDFEKILEKTFNEKARIEDSVFFYKVRDSSKQRGDANNQFMATRYDYLRIAKAMLDDWQNDTCVGKYLKTIWENRVDTENKKRRSEGKKTSWSYASGYAGQFRTHFKGINKKRPVMGMHGRGGQQIVIDFERSRIVAVNAVFGNYNHHRIVYKPIRKGK
ncbi:hypothetical protein OAI92_04210 [Candidatus Pelagibacter sp.]|nr:hypothetical protein [Candidatus Pelagibacter sp.]